eukprot:gnl/TRDRNA2_/TRDRNA2_133423_c1_seq1.p1 gnl/TRDRNA2_/TRDRNA2_133423_c1~~gnl/TRDRNA2_/TRDRNA2_133423_c1_seq1.p1  ORF type:complete len:275 (+),score=31.57 gnl/TRDRNA2_/TRDRNA2_133423_c1_seq1:115-825(+)
MAAAGTVAIVAGIVVPSQWERPWCAPVSRKWKDERLATRLWIGLRTAATTNFDELFLSVAGGFAVTAAVIAFLPSGGLARAALLGGISGRAVVLLISVPLQFCEHAVVPLAAALQRAGASGGLAFAVLATVPGLNTGSLSIIAKIAGVTAAARVVIAVWLSGFLASYLADWAGAGVVQVGHSAEILPDWYVSTSRWVVLIIAACAVWRHRRLLLVTAEQKEDPNNCCEGRFSCKKD